MSGITVNIGDKFKLFGAQTIYVITSVGSAGHWVISVKPELNSNESLDGVLITPELLNDGIKTRKLIKA